MLFKVTSLVQVYLIVQLRFELSLAQTCVDVATYYETVDLAATNEELKKQLKALINPHTVLDYDAIWTVFESVDVFLPSYPCDPTNSSFIPDVYSSYCWDPEKSVAGGECGNYSKEGDCYNREHVSRALA